MLKHTTGVSFCKQAKIYWARPLQAAMAIFMVNTSPTAQENFLGTALVMSKEIISINDRNCLAALLCASNVSIMN